MLEHLPYRAFFSFEVALPRWDKPVRLDGNLAKYGKRYLAPTLCELDNQKPFADVYWAWCDEGILFAYDVSGRRGTPVCSTKEWWKHDGARLCIDTRDTRDLKRGSRFCHFFYFLPLGGGRDGRNTVGALHRMSRAKEHPPAIDELRILVTSRVQRSGYQLEALIRADCLNGWNPAEHPRIGVFYKINDTQLGSQTLTVSDDLGWNVDPSTWAVGVLEP